MSGPLAIRIENLSKRYRIGSGPGYQTLRDSIVSGMRMPLSRLASMFFRKHAGEHGSPTLSTWALRDVSFDVNFGEVVGIIGANGAGKSTLLKILSRVTAPTSGMAEVHGRVGSLLEVGTGFHSELTGRENVYLSGAILGMRRREIERKFDAIVEFAGVQKFIDTPVKHYSSGMYVRLAFAVGVHLEPEILFIDEVLAVGDAEFQKRCFEKIREIGSGGRTILFVSHNMAAIRQICTRGIALEHGKVVDHGELNGVVDRYLARVNASPASSERIETPTFLVSAVSITSAAGPVLKTFDQAEIVVRFTPKSEILDPGLYIGFLTADNVRVSGLDFKDLHSIPALESGRPAEMGFRVESFPLLPGQYLLEIHLKDMASHRVEIVGRQFPFEVVESPVYGGRRLDRWYGNTGMRAVAFSRQVKPSEGAD